MSAYFFSTHPSSATTKTKIERLKDKLKKIIIRFPHRFDNDLSKGFERLMANSSKDFITTRSFSHLQTLLLTQFFLQKKMEESLKEERSHQHPLFIKLFKASSRICIGLAASNAHHFSPEKIVRIFQLLLPGIDFVPSSSFLCHHPEAPYFFCYLEIHKLRGKDLQIDELKKLQGMLKEQLLNIPPLTPALFWPYNEEESFRQVQLLQKELRQEKDLPQLSIQFREQTSTTLEFLVHLVSPKSIKPLKNVLKQLPDSLGLFIHHLASIKQPFPIEIGILTLKIPAAEFNEHHSINLLYARRSIIKHLEALLGPIRDYNGGLLEKQQDHFEIIRSQLCGKIPLFDLFGERLFYAIYPMEKRLSLSIAEIETLFRAVTELMREKRTYIVRAFPHNLMVIKAEKSPDLFRFNQFCSNAKEKVCHAQISLGGYHYFCLLRLSEQQFHTLSQSPQSKEKRIRPLRLFFQEGAPLSLNPHQSLGDMRCRLLSKLLFEGLVRLDEHGLPTLAGAIQYDVSSDGLIYRFKLRPHCWSNGERVTAFDYVTSCQNALKDSINHPEFLFVIKNAQKYKEKGVEAQFLGISAQSIDLLQFKLEWPDTNFLTKLAHPCFFPLFGSIKEPQWFNGPYTVQKRSNGSLVLQPNPYFWNKKQRFFDQIEIKWIRDIKTIHTLFEQEKVDWIGDPISSLSSPLIRSLQKAGKLRSQKVNRHFVLCFNTLHPTLGSSAIRQALSLSIDRREICEKVFPHCIPSKPHFPAKKMANQYFEEGLKELGFSRKNFPTLTLTYSHQAGRKESALCLQHCWQEILGIKIRLEEVEWNLFRNKLEKGLFEIMGTIQDLVGNHSLEFLKRFEGPSSWNFSKWTHSQYRHIIEVAQEQKEAHQRQHLLKQAETILQQQTPFTSLFTYVHHYAHSPMLEDYLLDQEGCIDFSRAHFRRNAHVESKNSF